jgi:hypothetical protein
VDDTNILRPRRGRPSRVPQIAGNDGDTGQNIPSGTASVSTRRTRSSRSNDGSGESNQSGT